MGISSLKSLWLILFASSIFATDTFVSVLFRCVVSTGIVMYGPLFASSSCVFSNNIRFDSNVLLVLQRCTLNSSFLVPMYSTSSTPPIRLNALVILY